MIPYLKKGSPLIVFGELSKPEIFTDKEGRPQVSMNITANNLLFSPFGRPDGQSQGQQQGGFSAPQTQQPQEQGQHESFQEAPAGALADEEIPF
jgi:single-strand DNA-binding protein